MIRVTIQHKGKQITVTCNKAVCTTKNTVTCYDYTQDDDNVVKYYSGYIVSVTTA